MIPNKPNSTYPSYFHNVEMWMSPGIGRILVDYSKHSQYGKRNYWGLDQDGLRHTYFEVYDTPIIGVLNLSEAIADEEIRLGLSDNEMSWHHRHHRLREHEGSEYGKPKRLNLEGEWKTVTNYNLEPKMGPFQSPKPENDFDTRYALDITDHFPGRSYDRDEMNFPVNGGQNVIGAPFPMRKICEEWAPFDPDVVHELKCYILEEERRLALPSLGRWNEFSERHQRLLLCTQSDYGKPLMSFAHPSSTIHGQVLSDERGAVFDAPGTYEICWDYYVEGRAKASGKRAERGCSDCNEIREERKDPKKLCMLCHMGLGPNAVNIWHLEGIGE